MEIAIHSESDFIAMRKAGAVVAEVLDAITPYVQPGVTTLELNDICHKLIEDRGAKPAALGYKGFPKSVCISVNHVVCHGIPDNRRLLPGDILNIDSAVIVDGWYGDSGRMYWAGDKVPIHRKRLTQVTYDSMMRAIEKVRPGEKLSTIGKTIQEYVESFGYSVVRDFCGHGLGKTFHAEPNVLHYYDPQFPDCILKEGMFFTIEPMINLGGHGLVIMKDGWTAVTKDKKESAQFEHSIAVTEHGAEIFTLSPKGWHYPPYA